MLLLHVVCNKYAMIASGFFIIKAVLLAQYF